MSSVRLAVLGIGSLRCGPAVVGSLATYFGERPLDVRIYDADEERLDLFDRFMRTAFTANKAPHNLFASEEVEEVLLDATDVIFAVGPNCARRIVGSVTASVQDAANQIFGLVSTDLRLLSLCGDIVTLPFQHWSVDWPQSPSPSQRVSLPHQILRYVYGDEYLHEFFRQHEQTPIKTWLDNPMALPVVVS